MAHVCEENEEGRMRVCDRHPRTEAKGKLILTDSDSQYDLCEQCIEEVQKLMSDPKAEVVEQKRSILGLRRNSA